MSTPSNELMGFVRSHLHMPRPDATTIVCAIKACPDAHAREVAEHYAHEHFRRIQARENIGTWRAPNDVRMRYDPASHILSAPDGSTIKKMCCPLEKRWEDLEALDTRHAARHCDACRRHVHDIKGLTAREVQHMVEDDPEVCLHVHPMHENVVFLTSSKLVEPRPEPEPEPELEQYSGVRGILRKWLGRVYKEPLPNRGLPVIRTTSSCVDINVNAALGYRPLIKRAALMGEGGFIQVWQNSSTRQIAVQIDRRCVPMSPPYSEWEIVLEAFSYEPNYNITPFAAYLIPPDLEPGTRVRLDACIEVPSSHNHAFTMPWSQVDGVWTGEDIEIETAPHHAYFMPITG